MVENQLWVLCPICGSKTRIKIRKDTELINFPLFCPKCKHESLINIILQFSNYYLLLKMNIKLDKVIVRAIKMNFKNFFKLAKTFLNCKTNEY